MIRVDVHFHGGDDPRIGEILNLLQSMKAREIQMARTLDETLAAVQQESTVDDSIIALLEGLKSQIEAAKGDQTKIDAIFDAATANAAKVSAAVTANTPAG